MAHTLDDDRTTQLIDPNNPDYKSLDYKTTAAFACKSGDPAKSSSHPAFAKLLDELNQELTSQAMPAMRELARFALGPRYEAYFISGKAAQITKFGNLSHVQHEGGKIKEVVKLRDLRPGQIANLAFSFVTMVVGMAHMARINRQLAQLNEKIDEIAAMLTDELAAPVMDIVGSIHRFTADGVDGISRETAESWIRDLRRVRQKLIAKIERLSGRIQRTTSWSWGDKVKDLKTGAAQMTEARRFIELLAISDEMLHRMAMSLDAPWALDGVDGTVATQLARKVDAAVTALMASAKEDTFYDVRDCNRALSFTTSSFKKLIEQLTEADAERDVSLRLMDDKREFYLRVRLKTIPHKIIALRYGVSSFGRMP